MPSWCAARASSRFSSGVALSRASSTAASRAPRAARRCGELVGELANEILLVHVHRFAPGRLASNFGASMHACAIRSRSRTFPIRPVPMSRTSPLAGRRPGPRRERDRVGIVATAADGSAGPGRAAGRSARPRAAGRGHGPARPGDSRSTSSTATPAPTRSRSRPPRAHRRLVGRYRSTPTTPARYASPWLGVIVDDSLVVDGYWAQGRWDLRRCSPDERAPSRIIAGLLDRRRAVAAGRRAPRASRVRTLPAVAPQQLIVNARVRSRLPSRRRRVACSLLGDAA